jgi:hypothetical protein
VAANGDAGTVSEHTFGPARQVPLARLRPASPGAVRTAGTPRVARPAGNLELLVASIGHRFQSLADRQLDALTDLAGEDAGNAKLALATRLARRVRRASKSLQVLADDPDSREVAPNTPITEVIAAALADNDDFARIDFRSVHPAQVDGEVVPDLVHLLAELIDNAAVSSRANGTRVAVLGRRSDDAYLLSVVDEGTGIAADQRNVANERVQAPPRLTDQSPAAFGLPTVGRLAARHGIGVVLLEAATDGVIAKVRLPARLVGGEDGGPAGPRAKDRPPVGAERAGRRADRADIGDARAITPATLAPDAEAMTAQAMTAEARTAEAMIAEARTAEAMIAEARTAEAAAVATGAPGAAGAAGTASAAEAATPAESGASTTPAGDGETAGEAPNERGAGPPSPGGPGWPPPRSPRPGSPPTASPSEPSAAATGGAGATLGRGRSGAAATPPDPSARADVARQVQRGRSIPQEPPVRNAMQPANLSRPPGRGTSPSARDRGGDADRSANRRSRGGGPGEDA